MQVFQAQKSNQFSERLSNGISFLVAMAFAVVTIAAALHSGII